MGDQDGDGNDDVAFPEVAQFPDGAPELNPAATVVYSGPDLLAPGPGGRLDERPVPLARYQGSSVAVAVLDPAGPPTVITGVRTPDGIDQLTLHGDPQVHLRAEGLLEEYTGGPGTITVTQRGTTRFVVLRSDTRGGSSLAIWNLDDPCSRYASGPLPPPPDTGSTTTTGPNTTTTTTTTGPTTAGPTTAGSTTAGPTTGTEGSETATPAVPLPGTATFTG